MITLVHRIKTHVLDVKVSKEFIAVVSNIMKHHFSVYSIFAKEFKCVTQRNGNFLECFQKLYFGFSAGRFTS